MVLKIPRITQTYKTEKKWSKEELYSCTTSRLCYQVVYTLRGSLANHRPFQWKRVVLLCCGLFAPTDEGFYLCQDSLRKVAPKSLVNRSIYLLFIWIQLVQWKISCGVDHGTWQSVLRITQWVPRPGTTLHHCWVQHRYHTSPAIVVSLKHGNYFARSSYKN